MNFKEAQISLTIELEGSVILRGDVKTFSVKTVEKKEVFDKRLGAVVLKTVVDSKGKPIVSEVVYKHRPIIGTKPATLHVNLPNSFIQNAISTPVKGFKPKMWETLPKMIRIENHIKELVMCHNGKSFSYEIVE